LRYEIKDLTPPKEILHAMQQQITAEREKRALIAASEGTSPGTNQHRHRESAKPLSRAPKVKNKPPSTTRRGKPPSILDGCRSQCPGH
jgi:regulator of protease activity HflC (stomatin/prohibitin superfamily)